MKINIGISEKNLKSTTGLLTTVLANEMVLYVKNRKAHWNAKGGSFMELHKLYESHYKNLEELIDQVAERIGKLGHSPVSTMLEFTKHASLKEKPGQLLGSKDMNRELLKDHESVIIELRSHVEDCATKFKDAGTADFLTYMMEEHETMAWVLRRYLD